MSAQTAQQNKKIGKAVQEALDRGVGAIDLTQLPNLTDMSAESITENVHAINSLCKHDRLKFVMTHLVNHLHDFARSVGLTTEEWMQGIQFLTKTGQTCSDIRQEFILLSDVLGLSALVDSMNHPKPQGASDATVLGPFHTEDTQEHEVPNGGSIASEGKGEYMYVKGRVTDTQGKPVADCTIETWETDDEGLYDTQYADRDGPDCRGKVVTDSEGNYAFRCVRPVPYPIPNDGPVGGLLTHLHRHVFRPAHLHFWFKPPNEYEDLITAVYLKGDPYLQSDAVFGVKSSLVVDVEEVTDQNKAKELGFKSAPFYMLERDWILITKEQAEVEKRKSLKAYYDSIQQK
ncbi:hypothetical protein OIO90_004168 [Microbotryomycetes sp. JL221]|nr:hypothetical protein OIO90_004168 [Microbotryomycetes sp. JL221]